jgi:hypothetical protein
LGGGEAGLLEPLAVVAASGRTPADDVLAEYTRAAGDMKKLIAAIEY